MLWVWHYSAYCLMQMMTLQLIPMECMRCISSIQSFILSNRYDTKHSHTGRKWVKKKHNSHYMRSANTRIHSCDTTKIACALNSMMLVSMLYCLYHKHIAFYCGNFNHRLLFAFHFVFIRIICIPLVVRCGEHRLLLRMKCFFYIQFSPYSQKTGLMLFSRGCIIFTSIHHYFRLKIHFHQFTN